jgi:hypothetical protein
MMLTERKYLDVFDYYHFIMVFVEHRTVEDIFVKTIPY